MTTLTLHFLGSDFSYAPNHIDTAVDHTHITKYRGIAYEPHEPIVATTTTKGLKYRGITY